MEEPETERGKTSGGISVWNPVKAESNSGKFREGERGGGVGNESQSISVAADADVQTPLSYLMLARMGGTLNA